MASVHTAQNDEVENGAWSGDPGLPQSVREQKRAPEHSSEKAPGGATILGGIVLILERVCKQVRGQ